MAQAIFPAPDHDHHRCANDAFAHAEMLCAKSGQRLTPMRGGVLKALLGSHKALGAYEIMERVGGEKGRPAPITVYRALDFLIEQGFVHRIQSRNAFVACVHRHESDDLVAFLICDHCGSVGEAPSGAAAGTLSAAAKAAGFTPKMPVIEIAGVCAHCRDE